MAENDKPARVETEMDKKVFDTMAEWHRLQDENEKLRASNTQWEAAYQRVEHENALLRTLKVDIETQKNFYHRQATELATRLTDVHRMVGMALNDVRAAGYRPSPTGQPPRPPAVRPQPQHHTGEPYHDDGAEVPKFLSGPKPSLETEIASTVRER